MEATIFTISNALWQKKTITLKYLMAYQLTTKDLYLVNSIFPN